MADPELSVVVVAYDMARELPRTLASLGSAFQRGVALDQYEVIVVDNGSTVPVTLDATSPATNVRIVHEDHASQSPATAVNRAIRACRGELVGVIVDGARMASPRLLSFALMARRLADRPVISPLAWHLGPVRHAQASTAGYDADVEDALLASVGWPADPYRLFEISTLAASSGRGWFGPLAESSALFMPRTLWDEIGGYEESFVSPGGGYMNHDVYLRASQASGTTLVTLIGEGTFHQIHGGAATSDASAASRMRAEYEQIRGMRYRPPTAEPLLLGHLPPEAQVHLEASVAWLKS